MGEAEDLKLGQTVALKFLPPSLLQAQDALERFHREVRLARQVSHPNVCRVNRVQLGIAPVFALVCPPTNSRPFPCRLVRCRNMRRDGAGPLRCRLRKSARALLSGRDGNNC
jgi:serine/threonine protein kinase